MVGKYNPLSWTQLSKSFNSILFGEFNATWFLFKISTFEFSWEVLFLEIVKLYGAKSSTLIPLGILMVVYDMYFNEQTGGRVLLPPKYFNPDLKKILC